MTETPAAEERALDALTKILESAVSEETVAAQRLVLRRLATSGDLFPSRIPPPLNITQVGGFLNLVRDDPVLYAQVLASALGVAGPNPTPGFEATLPPLYVTSRTNDRPAGSAQAATPVAYRVRNDFAPALDAAIAGLHARGVQLPVLAADALLPPVAAGGPPDDLLPHLGRRLSVVPSAALVDPTTDPLAVGQRGGSGPTLVLARQLDTTAPEAAAVPSEAYALWTCDATTCTQTTVTGAYVDLDAALGPAGWHRPGALAAPTSLGDTQDWHTWQNVTGLVAGRSTFGDELRLLYPLGQIAASSVRERQDWVWDGMTFVAPSS